jgi:hypothetical protein
MLSNVRGSGSRNALKPGGGTAIARKVGGTRAGYGPAADIALKAGGPVLEMLGASDPCA